MRKLIALLAVAASLGGCAVAPGYGNALPYDSVYGYPSYGPGYGTCGIWGDCGAWGDRYGNYWHGDRWHGGWHGGRGGWGGHGGEGGHGGRGGHGGGGGHGSGR
ncbi:hypothetical protein PQR41_31260 [Paraburkholderia xenovorans]